MYTYRRLLILILLIGSGGYLCGTDAISAMQHTRIHEQLRTRFEDGGTSRVSHIADVRLHVPVLVARFYQQRFYQPAWHDANGPSPLIDTLIEHIASVDSEGLDPRDYHLSYLAPES